MPGFGFPKSRRILRRSDFRKVYDEGTRYSCPLFAAFCLRNSEAQDGPRIGFTVTRAMGNAVVRNRMRRRMREAVRLNLEGLPPQWWIVFNPRKPLLEASFKDIEAEVRKVISRCGTS